ncbi:hypothetical protein B0T14DRAFT_432891 [Immersiella caudata]|uniref:VOC domain-containing protein n=1 Tax=Immersiella caudata TaxID=314043 RepID=A0AA40BZ85_9PEZI|nr:hypothetical protein B0T14DRAFT_432891 [Immersiella caudata]
MVIAHTGIKVTEDNIAKVAEWYGKALEPLGYKKMRSFLDGLATGFSDHADGNEADWWVSGVLEGATALEVTVPNSHYAFTVKGGVTVDGFYKAGVEAGGKCNGPPGVRANYGPNYYAAFVFDPAGNDIEVAYDGLV